MIDMNRLLTLQETLFLLMALGIFFRRRIVDGRFEAGLTAILAAKYHGDVGFASGGVTVTTLLSILTIPLWCLLL